MQTRKIEIQVKSKRGRYLELAVPSEMVVCPGCEGRSKELVGGCDLCSNANVIEVVCQVFLRDHERIRQAWKRFNREELDEPWIRYSERMGGF